MKDSDLVGIFMNEGYESAADAFCRYYTLVVPIENPPPGMPDKISSVSKIDVLQMCQDQYAKEFLAGKEFVLEGVSSKAGAKTIFSFNKNKSQLNITEIDGENKLSRAVSFDSREAERAAFPDEYKNGTDRPMKVVINSEHGGFGLSIKALSQLGASHHSEYRYKRNDPKLVACVERLGERANDFQSQLAVITIPPHSAYKLRIEEDGRESLEPIDKNHYISVGTFCGLSDDGMRQSFSECIDDIKNGACIDSMLAGKSVEVRISDDITVATCSIAPDDSLEIKFDDNDIIHETFTQTALAQIDTIRANHETKEDKAHNSNNTHIIDNEAR